MDENYVHSLINYERLVCELVQSVNFGISISQPVLPLCLGVCRATVTPRKPFLCGLQILEICY